MNTNLQEKPIPEKPNLVSAHYDGPEGVPPPPDYVVARTREGEVASVYSDNTWDMTAYQRRRSSTKLHFNNFFEDSPNDLQRIIINDMKWLLFLETWSKSMSVSTMQNRVSMLKSMAMFSYARSMTISSLLTNPILFVEYIDSAPRHFIGRLSSFISHLVTLGEKSVGFRVLTGISRTELAKLGTNYGKGNKQHPLIPTRIYSQIIQNLMRELDAFESVSSRFLSMVDQCATNMLVGRSKASQRITHQKLGSNFSSDRLQPTFSELSSTHGLENYFRDVQNRHGQPFTEVKNLASWVKQIQFVCGQILLIFTGMRDAEVSRLPFDCLETFKTHGKQHYRVAGHTTKFAGEISKASRWVTSAQGAQAVRVAQQVARVIYKSLGDIPTGEKSRSFDYPLFIGTSYLGFSPGINKKLLPPYSSSKNSTCADRLITIFPKIESEDIKELESVDPSRPWREEGKFQIGNRWPITNHQYRRSLAIYASSSGLVSLPSLRRNFQHITDEMVVYYARGSEFAKNLAGDDKQHFCHEYQAAQPEAQALAYIANVLLSEEPLFGAHGAWAKIHGKTDTPLTIDTRDVTIRRFRKGEIAYTETPLGGCTTVDPCDKKAMRSISACLDCSRAVIKPSKLGRVIKLQNAFLETLPPKSVEWQTEKAELESLRSYQSRIKSKSGGSS